MADLKLFSPIPSKAVDIKSRGADVAFGNTRPQAREVVLGLRERGAAGDAPFDSKTGAGRVPETAGDYSHARSNGIRVIPLLFEVFGGWSPEVEQLFQEAIEVRTNKLTAREYEETTWSARSWYSFAKQQISVALHRAVAWEIGGALRIAARAGADPRGAYVAGG